MRCTVSVRILQMRFTSAMHALRVVREMLKGMARARTKVTAAVIATEVGRMKLQVAALSTGVIKVRATATRAVATKRATWIQGPAMHPVPAERSFEVSETSPGMRELMTEVTTATVLRKAMGTMTDLSAHWTATGDLTEAMLRRPKTMIAEAMEVMREMQETMLQPLTGMIGLQGMMPDEVEAKLLARRYMWEICLQIFPKRRSFKFSAPTGLWTMYTS
mmetsp:Transcript_62169/g.148221  ORF Transcript_62169/g.148221 Transcript_62169/m.148221 type:complete len:219 (+) Transcript_62169:265-921(+)